MTVWTLTCIGLIFRRRSSTLEIYWWHIMCFDDTFCVLMTYSVQSFIYDPLTNINNEATFLKCFLLILKLPFRTTRKHLVESSLMFSGTTWTVILNFSTTQWYAGEYSKYKTCSYTEVNIYRHCNNYSSNHLKAQWRVWLAEVDINHWKYA